MKINSELPIKMLQYNMELNEIDFVLFHLYVSNPTYRDYYKSLRNEHPDRIMILDNSAYEFYIKGEKLDLAQFKQVIEELVPTYYILPDTLMDRQATLQAVDEFISNHTPDCNSEPIAVAQGMTENELIECLHIYSDNGVNNICIPFHNKFFKEYPIVQDEITEDFLKYYNIDQPTDDMKYAIGRVRFMKKHEKLLKSFDYVHLLGSHCPFEKKFYKDFDSMDTGYPVKLGYEKTILGKEKMKPQSIIDDFIDDELSVWQRMLIHNNVDIFKKY